MRIEQLKLNNIGSFSGEHVFSFDVEDIQKNIVLIGGRNGAGKTTLFESMRLCLYGYKLYGYRQNSQAYTNKIKRLINDTAKTELATSASITMQILIEDGYANSGFEINRNWALDGKNLIENLSVLKEDQLLSSDELQDFENYLLQTIPPSLFNFHFFMGKISPSSYLTGQMGMRSVKHSYRFAALIRLTCLKINCRATSVIKRAARTMIPKGNSILQDKNCRQ